MLIFLERTSRNSRSLSSVRSWPPKRTCPAVGSDRPLSMRSSVDLPDPDSPMTTKISPGSTVKDASMTAAVVPSARSSSRTSPWSLRTSSWRSRSTAWSCFLPKTLYRFSASSLADTLTSWLGGRDGAQSSPNS
ncbi:hypothetical protein STENM327S_08475 [Streptomyces tendae]